MFKVTLIFSFFLLSGCEPSTQNQELEKFELELNTDSEKRLDAAYAEIQRECDSLMTHEVPRRVDSILQQQNKANKK